jgi:hypothetical protein
MGADQLARAGAAVDRATAAWEAALAAALAEGAPLAPRLEAAEAALVAALTRWNAVHAATMAMNIRRRREERDAA